MDAIVGLAHLTSRSPVGCFTCGYCGQSITGEKVAGNSRMAGFLYMLIIDVQTIAQDQTILEDVGRQRDWNRQWSTI